jgi:very-short-patch-repair endonuclease
VHASDLPDLEVQVPVVDRSGSVLLHADLGYSRWKIAVEYEGRQHAERRQFGLDIDRYSLMASSGWLVLRFGETQLARRTQVVDRLAGALLSRGARW